MIEVILNHYLVISNYLLRLNRCHSRWNTKVKTFISRISIGIDPVLGVFLPCYLLLFGAHCNLLPTLSYWYFYLHLPRTSVA